MLKVPSHGDSNSLKTAREVEQDTFAEGGPTTSGSRSPEEESMIEREEFGVVPNYQNRYGRAAALECSVRQLLSVSPTSILIRP